MSNFFNRAAHATATAGTGTITLGSALGAVALNLASFESFSAAGVIDGTVVSYVILDSNGAWEVGIGTYTAAGTTLSRTVTKSSNANAAISLSGNAQVFITARAEDLLSVSNTQNANQIFAGPSSGGAAVPGFRSLVMADLPSLSPTSAVLGGDVAINNTATTFDIISIAQGGTGTWFASANATFTDTAGASNFQWKLWDGTTVIASTQIATPGASFPEQVSLSGFLASPAGNLRISVHNPASTTGVVKANQSTSGKDTVIYAFRIA